jgi:hypothetical protein
MLIHPVTRTQLGDQGLIQAPGMAEVDILQGRRLAQAGLTETGFHSAVVPVGHFPVDEQAQAFLEGQGVNLGEALLIFKGPDHTEQPQGLEFFKRGKKNISNIKYQNANIKFGGS